MRASLCGSSKNTNTPVKDIAQSRRSFGEAGSIDSALSRPWSLSASDVVELLEWAGAILLAMQLRGGRPRMRGNAWPEYLTTFAESYGWTNERLRPAIPGAHDISCMDVILGWISYIPLDRYVLRRIVGARALVAPVTQRHLFSFNRIAQSLGCDYRAVKKWHADGVALIVSGLHCVPTHGDIRLHRNGIDNRVGNMRP